MKTQCERCRTFLGPADEADICSFECTFCPQCADDIEGVCPNCSGELVRRPRRDPMSKVATGIGHRIKTDLENLTSPRQVPHVSVERVIPASARAIFDVLASPARHAEIDGSGTLTGNPRGPERLYLAARFGMGMSQQGVPYVSTNEVVEFVENRLICWQTYGELKGHKLIGGQKWRYELEPQEDGAEPTTLVRATYDWSQARAGRFTIEAMGFPAKSKDAMEATLRRLEAAATAP